MVDFGEYREHFNIPAITKLYVRYLFSADMPRPPVLAPAVGKDRKLRAMEDFGLSVPSEQLFFGLDWT